MIGKLHWAFAVALCGGLFAPAAAQDPVSGEIEQEIELLKARVDGFFGSLTNKSLGPERALRQLIENSPLKDRTEEINKLIDQAGMLEARYGAYSGHDFASSKAVGSDLIFLRYLYKGERFPVVFYFTFYRAGSLGTVKREWSLIALRFDSRIEALEAGAARFARRTSSRRTGTWHTRFRSLRRGQRPPPARNARRHSRPRPGTGSAPGCPATRRS
jgi:hypothetical protein